MALFSSVIRLSLHSKLWTCLRLMSFAEGPRSGVTLGVFAPGKEETLPPPAEQSNQHSGIKICRYTAWWSLFSLIAIKRREPSNQWEMRIRFIGFLSMTPLTAIRVLTGRHCTYFWDGESLKLDYWTSIYPLRKSILSWKDTNNLFVFQSFYARNRG